MNVSVNHFITVPTSHNIGNNTEKSISLKMVHAEKTGFVFAISCTVVMEFYIGFKEKVLVCPYDLMPEFLFREFRFVLISPNLYQRDIPEDIAEI
jgi:hypothetical protein